MLGLLDDLIHFTVAYGGGAGHAKLANDGKGKCLGNIPPPPILAFLSDKRLNLRITIAPFYYKIMQ